MSLGVCSKCRELVVKLMTMTNPARRKTMVKIMIMKAMVEMKTGILTRTMKIDISISQYILLAAAKGSSIIVIIFTRVHSVRWEGMGQGRHTLL